MSEVIPFVPKHELDCQTNLNDFIFRAKHQLTIYEDQGGFSSSNWKHYLANGRAQSMEFTGLAEKGRKTGYPMEPPFVDFAKAYVRDSQTWNATNPGNMMMVLKTCHDALLFIYSKADILLLDGIVLRKITEMIYERSSESSRYRYGQMLEKFLEDLRLLKINITIPVWKNPWKRPGNKAQGTSEEDRKWQENRLLTSFEITALADAFRLAKTAYQKFYSSQAVLLMCAPSRGGELSFLTVDCLFEETHSEKVSNEETQQLEDKETTILYIRWKAEKGGGFISKPVHPLIAPTVKEAVKRLIEIGEPARKAAKWAIETPSQFYRHDGCITSKEHDEDAPLTVAEFAAAFNLKDSSVGQDTVSIDIDTIKRLYKQKWVENLVDAKRYLTYRDLAKFTIQKYGRKFPKWPQIPEVNQPIHNLLCLIRENEFHNDFEPKQYSFECPNLNLLNDALGGRLRKRKI